MTRSTRIALLATLAAVSAVVFLVMRDGAPEVVQTRTSASQIGVVEAAPMPHVAMRNVAAHESASRRNLFAYVDAPRIIAAAQPAPARVEPPAPIAAAPQPVIVEAPPAPRFPYRFIGRFGPDANPVAAFTLEGQVITGRRGDRVGNYVIRAIGRESVDVESDGINMRVALGQ